MKISASFINPWYRNLPTKAKKLARGAAQKCWRNLLHFL